MHVFWDKLFHHDLKWGWRLKFVIFYFKFEITSVLCIIFFCLSSQITVHRFVWFFLFILFMRGFSTQAYLIYCIAAISVRLTQHRFEHVLQLDVVYWKKFLTNIKLETIFILPLITITSSRTLNILALVAS